MTERDLEWEWIEPILPKGKPFGRRRKVSQGAILNAIFDRADNGVKWRNLPADFPPVADGLWIFPAVGAAGCVGEN